MLERGREVKEGLVEPFSKREVGEGGREVGFYRRVECVAKSEMGERRERGGEGRGDFQMKMFGGGRNGSN